MVDANQIVYQDESYPLEVCAEITYIGSNPVLTTKKNKKRFGRLKNLTYLCRTNNGGRKFSDECPTPVKKRRSSLTYYIKDKVTTNPLVIGSF